MLIMYAEDNEADIALLEAAFKISGFAPDLIIARDGTQAIETIEAMHRQGKPFPDIFLLDLNLPRMSGYRVLEILKARDEFAPLTIIIFTGSSNPEDRVRCLALGADGYWQKPQGLRDTRELVKRLMSFGKEVHSAAQ